MYVVYSLFQYMASRDTNVFFFNSQDPISRGSHRLVYLKRMSRLSKGKLKTGEWTSHSKFFSV